MLKIFCNNSFRRAICLLLTVVFLSSFPTSATALALCLDEDKSRIIGQNFFLADCLFSVEAELLLSDKHSAAFAEKENNDCVDVSLTNANTLNLPSKVTLPGFTKSILSYTLPSRQIELQQQVTGINSSTFSQNLFILSHTNSLRTVVLLT